MEKEHIIKALDCCTRGRKSKDDRPCFECPYNECNLVGGTGERQISGTCQGWLMKDALSIIREQEKRIEELETSCTELTRNSHACKADTVRKMQEAIEERCIKGGIYPAFVKSVVEAIAKELEGGDTNDIGGTR